MLQPTFSHIPGDQEGSWGISWGWGTQAISEARCICIIFKQGRGVLALRRKNSPLLKKLFYCCSRKNSPLLWAWVIQRKLEVQDGEGGYQHRYPILYRSPMLSQPRLSPWHRRPALVGSLVFFGLRWLFPGPGPQLSLVSNAVSL